MRRIRSVNRKARTKIRNSYPDSVLDRWNSYIQAIENKCVYLLMKSWWGSEECVGRFPRRLFKNIPLTEGVLIDVVLWKKKKIVVELTPSIKRYPSSIPTDFSGFDKPKGWYDSIFPTKELRDHWHDLMGEQHAQN